MSLIKYFLPSKNTAATGIVQITAQASKSPQRVISLKLPLNIAKPTGRVRIDSVFVTISGHIKLFHVVTKVKIVNVAIAGAASGSAILKRIENIASVNFCGFIQIFW